MQYFFISLIVLSVLFLILLHVLDYFDLLDYCFDFPHFFYVYLNFLFVFLLIIGIFGCMEDISLKDIPQPHHCCECCIDVSED